jgi:hypothetical protein
MVRELLGDSEPDRAGVLVEDVHETINDSCRSICTDTLVAAITACLLAAGFWYRVGRRGWSKSHRFCRVNRNRRDRVWSLIWRHSGATMLFAKFIVGSNVVSLLAGQAGLSAARFLIYDCIGSLTWSGSYIALGFLLHDQLHWTLAQTIRPLLVVRAAIFLAISWRRRSLPHAAMMALATAFLCPVRPVSQYGAGMGMSAHILPDSRRLPEYTIDRLKTFSILTTAGFWRRFRG